MAMRQIPNILPPAWVVRQVLNDYGVDLELEPFHQGRSLGNLLLVQVKGISSKPNFDEPWSFSMKVNGLLYAEMFTVPVLLFVRPVHAEESSFRFLWLQEYIAVDLNVRNPNWRGQGSVTLHLPPANNFPGELSLERLKFIAARPRRTAELGVLTHLANEYRYTEDRYNAFANEDDLKQLDEIMDAVFKLESLFGPNGWPWSRMLAAQHLEGPRWIIKKLLAGERIELNEIPGWRVVNENIADIELAREHIPKHQLRMAGDSLLAIAAQANNLELKKAVYQELGDHDF